MPLANYTTTVPSSRSTMLIHDLLAKAGVNAIMFDYENHEPSAITFRIDKPDRQVGFRLPCEWRKTRVILTKTKGVPFSKRTDEHAKMVTWRCIHDWLRAQLALVEIGAADIEQVMLPYTVTNNGQTLYERIKDAGLKKIGMG